MHVEKKKDLGGAKFEDGIGVKMGSGEDTATSVFSQFCCLSKPRRELLRVQSGFRGFESFGMVQIHIRLDIIFSTR